MKKRMLYKLSWGILLAGLTACSDLTDSYKEYLDWGERSMQERWIPWE